MYLTAQRSILLHDAMLPAKSSLVQLFLRTMLRSFGRSPLLCSPLQHRQIGLIQINEKAD